MNEIVYVPIKELQIKSQQQPKNGFIYQCCFCGEQVGNTAKYCPQHSTQKGRKKDFDLNVDVMLENRNNGRTMKSLRSWK